MKNTYTEIRPDKASLPKDKQRVIFKVQKAGVDYLLEGQYIEKEGHFLIGKREMSGHKLRTNFFFWFEVTEWKPKFVRKGKEVSVAQMRKVLGNNVVKGASETFVRFAYDRLVESGAIVNGRRNLKWRPGVPQ